MDERECAARAAATMSGSKLVPLGFLNHYFHRRSRMNRLKLGALLATIALTLFAIGCGGDSSNTNANANSNAAKSNMNSNMTMNK